MNLYSEFFKAYDSGNRKFFRNKKLIKLYIVPMKCQRREFFTVLTEKELAELKLKKRDEFRIIGDTEREKRIWEEVQAEINKPEIKRHDEMVGYINAERKARRLWQRIEDKRVNEEGNRPLMPDEEEHSEL